MTKLNFQLGGTLQVITEQENTGYALVSVRYDTFTITARGEEMAYTLPAGKQVDCQVSYVDAAGNPATVDGPVTWDTSDATIANIVVDAADDKQCAVQAVGATGQAQVSCTADADLGAGVTTLVCTLDVTVVAGEAVAGTITPVGAPVDITPAA